MGNPKSELLTGCDARQLAGLPTATWLELIETGQIPKPVRIGERFMWRRADVLRWIREMKACEVFA